MKIYCDDDGVCEFTVYGSVTGKPLGNVRYLIENRGAKKYSYCFEPAKMTQMEAEAKFKAYLGTV